MSKQALLCTIILYAVSAQADTLRLRNGTTIEGRFVSGTEKGIWFERGAEGTALYPLSFVENLSFGAFTPYSKSAPIPKTPAPERDAQRDAQIVKLPPRTPGSPQVKTVTVRWPANSFQ